MEIDGCSNAGSTPICHCQNFENVEKMWKKCVEVWDFIVQELCVV